MVAKLLTRHLRLNQMLHILHQLVNHHRHLKSGNQVTKRRQPRKSQWPLTITSRHHRIFHTVQSESIQLLHFPTRVTTTHQHTRTSHRKDTHQRKANLVQAIKSHTTNESSQRNIMPTLHLVERATHSLLSVLQQIRTHLDFPEDWTTLRSLITLTLLKESTCLLLRDQARKWTSRTLSWTILRE